jgi:lipopolysaccharide biosynthesis glycosyltransferase
MNQPLRIFIGYDVRQPIAYNVLQYSIASNASVPVQITPLVLNTLPIERIGLTQFTYSRYLVPYLCNYEGIAAFFDADMLVQGDVAELFSLIDPQCGVSVAKDKPRFEWPSLMLFNNANCRRLSLAMIEKRVPQHLEEWSDYGIGTLPPEWNYCVGYNHEAIEPKLIHYTAGIPIWPETKDCKFSDLWHACHKKMNASVSYQSLMGGSVHVQKVATGEINN